MELITNLDKALKEAFDNEGKTANKAYAVLLRSEFYMPVNKIENEEQPFIPFFLEEDEKIFIPVFDTLERLQSWADNTENTIDFVTLAGSELIRGIGEHITLCLNIGSSCYKEFYPDEILRLKKMVSKLDELKSKKPS
jgi:hypothetical protein